MTRVCLAAAALLWLTSIPSQQALSQTWVLEPELRIGALDGPAAFGRIVDVEVARDGRIFVADAHGLRISVFSSEGHFLCAFGRAGPGPGEFRQITGLSLARGGLYVFDNAANRLTRLSLDGEFLESWGPPRDAFQLPLMPRAPQAVFADGTLLTEPGLAVLDPLARVPLLRHDARGHSVDTLAWREVGEEVIRAEAGTWRANIPVPVHAGTRWDVAPGGHRLVLIYQSPTNNSRENRFRVLALTPAGAPVFDRVIRYRPVPIDPAAVEAERARLVDNMVSTRPITRRDAESLYDHGFSRIPPYQVGVDEVRASRDLTIWLRRGAFGAEEAEWLVLDGAGRSLATLRIPTAIEIRRVSRTHVWAVTTGEWDEPYVVRYRVRPSRDRPRRCRGLAARRTPSPT